MRAIITALLMSVIMSGVSQADLRPTTSDENAWAAAIRACAERKGVPRDDVAFNIVGHDLKVFFKSKHSAVRDECLKQAAPQPAGEKTGL